ncbi:hypothetical protein ONE63_002026 [Megalurothrips usitatus]|uniref:Uncharacterized protein n=1 Tax=Megalurothrips usitatus TaxID=439358 RepID=A0AAV7XH13_9NEOP|nr:hypothetical protein ONE63_002026 [Megalurothrips usitatus]
MFAVAAHLRRVPRGPAAEARRRLGGGLPRRPHDAGRAGPPLHGRLLVRPRLRLHRLLLGGVHADALAAPLPVAGARRHPLPLPPALPLPAAGRRRGPVRRPRQAGRGGARHVLQPPVRRVLPQALQAAEPQLPRHVPAQRHLPDEPAAEGGAALQARHDHCAPGLGAQGQGEATAAVGGAARRPGARQPQQDGARGARLGRLLRPGGLPRLLRRAVHVRPGAHEVVRRRPAAPRRLPGPGHARRLPLVPLLRAHARPQPAARLRARGGRHVFRLGLARLPA